MEGLAHIALNANNLGSLRVHEHIAPSKKRFLSEVIKRVVPQWSDENLGRGKSALMLLVNFSPILFHYVGQYETHHIVVVLHENVPVFHVEGVHVRMRVEDFMKCLICMMFSLDIV